MKFKAYEEKARVTDQFVGQPDRSIEVALKNILLESMGLQEISAAIKHCSNDEQKVNLRKEFAVKSGDVLWYLTNLCRHNGISLEDAAIQNLALIENRYAKKVGAGNTSYHKGNTHIEELPEKLEVAFVPMGSRLVVATALANGEAIQLGDRINDNSHSKDFYRFHDVLHFSYMVHLGWSPVMRSLFKRKRKNDSKIDEVEDGARAANLEEALTAFIFEHAKTRDMFRSQDRIDFDVLQTIDKLTGGLEVKQCNYEDWQRAILEGYKIFNMLVEGDGGVVKLDCSQKSLEFIPKTSSPDCFKKLFIGTTVTAEQVSNAAEEGINEAAEKNQKGRGSA